MKVSGIPFYQAHSSNYSRGRGGQAIIYFTVHHSAGFEATLRYLWQNPSRNASSHFFAGLGHREQYVDTNDTAWTNGNFSANQKSITCEVRGDWRNGYYSAKTLKQLEEIMLACLKKYPNLKLNFHNDIVGTICPADLKNKGYAKKAWANAKARLKAPTPKPKPKPTPSKITYKKITPKRIILTKDSNLWNFNFTAWNKAKAVKKYPKGTIIDVVAVATNALGGKYYLTAYSYNNGKVRATNGFNTVDVKDYVAPKPTPKPTPVAPKWVPLDNPRKLRTGQVVRVIDLDTLKETGDPIDKDTDISIVDKKTLSNGKMYFRSKWAKDNKKNWGVPADAMLEVPDAPEVPIETVPEPPIDTDPETPADTDVEVATGIIEAIKKLLDKLLDIILRRNK